MYILCGYSVYYISNKKIKDPFDGTSNPSHPHLKTYSRFKGLTLCHIFKLSYTFPNANVEINAIPLLDILFISLPE